MTGVFSSRVPGSLAPNRLSRILHRLRAEGHAIHDLTESNPTRVGIPYPDDLLAPLADIAGLTYEPEPLGLACARQAVALDYMRLGVSVDPDRVVLTSSTSEAYSTLFKLLCGPGESVLIPAPSYPLLEHLARLDGVGTESFWLEYHGRWSVDLGSLERALSPGVRAIVLVHPNNPTGSFVSADDLQAVAELCRARDLALIVDGVFADYCLVEDGGVNAAAAWPPDVLTCRLGGLSKSIGLPQVKLGWIALGGPDARVAEARARLEMICDTYLSVSTPVQLAARALLERGGAVRSRIQERVRHNHDALSRIVRRHPACQLRRTEAGWSSVIHVPAIRSEEALVVDLLEQDHVLVHPGYFFDFPREAFVIVSLLVPSNELSEGVERLLMRAEAP